jgi:hypothetical protein
MKLVRRLTTQGPMNSSRRSTVNGPARGTTQGPYFYPVEDFLYILLPGVEEFSLLFWHIGITQVTLGKLA